jgi:hypothetical protein
MARIDRLEIAKVVVAPAIALFVAVVGWVLTTRYNATQLDVATRRGAADIEIAQINAAMRYMELARNIPEGDASQRRQAIAIAAPVLPPNLAFRLAIDELPDDPATLDVLMRKYEDEAFPYLVRHLEVPFPQVHRALDPIPESGPYAKQPTDAERRASELLRYLRERGQSTSLFKNLVSNNYGNEQFRPIALLLYFEDYRSSLRDAAGYVVQQAYEKARVEDEFRSYMRDPSLSRRAKQAIAFAAAVVFGQQWDYQSDTFVREAAQRFWEGMDVGRGATPVEGSLEAYLFERVFHYNKPPGSDDWLRGKAIAATSASLRDAVLKANLSNLSFGNVRLVLYGYASSPTVGRDPAYLLPPDVVEVVRAILAWANTAERRKELAMELGSLSGHHVFLQMLPSSQPKQEFSKEEDDQRRCEAARAYANLLLDWYVKYHAPEWPPASFFHEVANEFPDLENRINRQAWGLGKAWPSESSRGCRK